MCVCMCVRALWAAVCVWWWWGGGARAGAGAGAGALLHAHTRACRLALALWPVLLSTPPALSSTHTHTQLRCARSPQLIAALLGHTQPCLPSLSPARLAQTVWALKRLAYAPSEVRQQRVRLCLWRAFVALLGARGWRRGAAADCARRAHARGATRARAAWPPPHQPQRRPGARRCMPPASATCRSCGRWRRRCCCAAWQQSRCVLWSACVGPQLHAPKGVTRPAAPQLAAH
jgi:hypothetical protein